MEKVSADPTLDTYGCWRIKLERYSAGRSIQVVVIVKKNHLEVVTVIEQRRKIMTDPTYHYTECGLSNIYLENGFQYIETSRGQAVSIKDASGLHRAIGLFLVTTKKDLIGEEIRFLRNEMLMSQHTLANLLGVSEQVLLLGKQKNRHPQTFGIINTATVWGTRT